MAKATWRIPVTLALTLAALAAVLVFAASAFAVPGDSAANAVEVFSGSSVTENMVASGNTGVFYLRILLDAGQTVRMQFTSGSGLLRLNPIKFPIDDTDSYAYSVNTPIAPGSDQWDSVLTFKAYKTGMYTVYCPSSSLGSFTVLPKLALTTTRISGLNRYETSVAVSKKAFPAGNVPAVVVASGTNFPDALAAAPLAEAYGGPVLLTNPLSMGASTITELKRLAPAKVFVAGSTSSVSTAVRGQIAAALPGATIVSFDGVNRFDTAARIADALRAKAGAPAKVVVVNGYSFADALSVAPLAAAKHWPILLTKADALPQFTADAVTRSGAGSSLVVGDSKGVYDSVLGSLPGALRKGGTDRYSTCSLIADYAVSQGCSYRHVALAKGTDFPDALSAGSYLGADGGIVLLTKPTALSAPIGTALSGAKASVSVLDVLGSTDSVADAVVSQAETALR